jgi:hypothetical protein
MQPRQILPATVAAWLPHEECSMNIPRKLLIAAGLAAVVTAGVLATAADVHAQHGRQAPVSIHDVATPVPSVSDGDPSVPDAAMALRGQPAVQGEQPATF